MRSSEWFAWLLLWVLIGLAAAGFLALQGTGSSGVLLAEGLRYAR